MLAIRGPAVGAVRVLAETLIPMGLFILCCGAAAWLGHGK